MDTATHGRQLGRYELIAEIATGGMGAVFLGRLAGAGGFQRLFAIKFLHQKYARDAEFTKMLLDEARIAARIHHPNVVGIQEVCESPEQGYYLVMDYIEGLSLWEILRGPPALEPSSRWQITNRIIVDALNGLHAAHVLLDDDGVPLKVVHRDVSPQNILVGVDGVSRVTDFGIAKATTRMTATRAGQVKGKIAYMAPEQASSRDVDARADVFAMGIVLWESLVGTRLFKCATDAETFAKVMSGPIPRARDHAPGVSPELEDVCARALERDRTRRFASAQEMAQALETAARRQRQLADAHEASAWIRETFATKLGSRRESLRFAASDAALGPGQRTADLPGGIRVPSLSQREASVTAPPRATKPVVAAESRDEPRTEIRAVDTTWDSGLLEAIAEEALIPDPEPVGTIDSQPASIESERPAVSSTRRSAGIVTVAIIVLLSAAGIAVGLTASKTTTPAPIAVAPPSRPRAPVETPRAPLDLPPTVAATPPVAAAVIVAPANEVTIAAAPDSGATQETATVRSAARPGADRRASARRAPVDAAVVERTSQRTSHEVGINGAAIME